MPTALLGWELGSGSGHLQRLVPIVAKLLAREVNVIAAIRDVGNAIALFNRFESSKPLSIIQVPTFLHRSGTPAVNRSLAEIFAYIVYADATLIAPAVYARRQIIATHKPDFIISDNAPSLNIAANGEYRIIVIGNGWTLPPSVSPLPALLADHSQGRPSGSAEDRIFEAVGKLRSIERPFDRFADILRGVSNFPSTVAMLDPYWAARQEPLYWPVEITTPPSPQQITGTGHGVLYCPSSHPTLQSMADALLRTGLPWRGCAKTGRSRRSIVASLSIRADRLSARVAGRRRRASSWRARNGDMVSR